MSVLNITSPDTRSLVEKECHVQFSIQFLLLHNSNYSANILTLPEKCTTMLNAPHNFLTNFNMDLSKYVTMCFVDKHILKLFSKEGLDLMIYSLCSQLTVLNSMTAKSPTAGFTNGLFLILHPSTATRNILFCQGQSFLVQTNQNILSCFSIQGFTTFL